MKIQQFIFNQFICYYWDTHVGMLQILWKHIHLNWLSNYTVLYNKGIFNKAALKKIIW